MTLLPQALRSRTPHVLRDDARVRALSLALGLIPPRSASFLVGLEPITEQIGCSSGVVEEVSALEGLEIKAM